MGASNGEEPTTKPGSDGVRRRPRSKIGGWIVRGMSAVALLAILIAQPLIDVVDPLELSSATQEVSARIAARVMAPFYNHDADAQDEVSPASREIAVIIIRDADIEEYGRVFPLSYRQQFALFRQILSYEPRAVFLDLIYTYDRGGLPEFAERLSRLAGQKTVAAQAGVSDTGMVIGIAGSAVKWTSQEALPVMTGPFETGIIGFTKLGEVYELSNLVRASVVGDEAVRFDGSPQTHGPVAPPSETADGEPLRPWPSAAVRLLQLACATDAKLPAAERKNYPGCDNLDAVLRQPVAKEMSVYWGGLPAVVWEPKVGDDPTALPEIAQASGCDVFGSDFDSRLNRSLSSVGATFQLLEASDPAPWCPPVVTIPANYFKTGNALTREYLSAALKDKLVLIGVSVVGASDRLSFYEHNAPGVMLHAMALDNLLNYGGAYLREPVVMSSLFGQETVFGYPIVDLGVTEAFWVDIGTLSALLLISLLLRPTLNRLARALTSNESLQDSIIATLWIAMACLVSAIVVALTFTYLRWPPHNWIGVIVYAGLANRVVRGLHSRRMRRASETSASSV